MRSTEGLDDRLILVGLEALNDDLHLHESAKEKTETY